MMLSWALYAGFFTDLPADAISKISFPIVAMALVAALSPGITSLVIALGVVSIPRFSRITRAAVLKKKSLDFVQAARALGKGRWAILTSDILPNCLSPIIVQVTLTLPSAIRGRSPFADPVQRQDRRAGRWSGGTARADSERRRSTVDG